MDLSKRKHNKWSNYSEKSSNKKFKQNHVYNEGNAHGAIGQND